MNVRLLCELVNSDGEAVTQRMWADFAVGRHAMRMTSSLSLPVCRSFSGALELAVYRHAGEEPFIVLPIKTASSALNPRDTMTLSGVSAEGGGVRLDVLLAAVPVRTFEQWKSSAPDLSLEAAYAAGFNAGSATTHILSQEATD